MRVSSEWVMWRKHLKFLFRIGAFRTWELADEFLREYYLKEEREGTKAP